MACEYCETLKFNILDSEKINLHLFIDEAYELYLQYDIETEAELTTYQEYKQINYCPMCGRKLNE